MTETLQAHSAAVLTTCDTPLCVDLDGTLLKTDLLHEGLARLLARPWLLFLAAFQLLRGRAALKHWVAARVPLDPSLLPYREDVLSWLRQQKQRGRYLVLATGADQSLAHAVAVHLNLFDEVMASDGFVNLTGHAKAERLVAEYGKGQFDYLGDSSTDRPVWAEARRAIRVEPAPHASKLKSVVKALRIRQWVKNILVFVPLITSHRWFHGPSIVLAAGAFLALSLCASAIYVINDLLDLDSDRRHATKRRRPFASGALSIPAGIVSVPLLLASAAIVSLFLPAGARLLLCIYLLATTAYSFYLKRKLLVDVFTLSMLYTMRVILGAAVIGMDCSPWLLGFSIFIFMSLAFCKRAAELSNLRTQNREGVAGRDYFVWDLGELNIFGVAAGYLAAIVLALYIHSPEVRLLYKSPEWLWVMVPLVVYWVSRTWILASRGAMNEDPIVFATRDRVTYFCAAIGAICLLLATTGAVHIPGVSA